VRSARTSKPGSRRSVHNPNAESFPALHENTTGVDTIRHCARLSGHDLRGTVRASELGAALAPNQQTQEPAE
jgi:hypothetical protein